MDRLQIEVRMTTLSAVADDPSNNNWVLTCQMTSNLVITSFLIPFLSPLWRPLLCEVCDFLTYKILATLAWSSDSVTTHRILWVSDGYSGHQTKPPFTWIFKMKLTLAGRKFILKSVPDYLCIWRLLWSPRSKYFMFWPFGLLFMGPLTACSNHAFSDLSHWPIFHHSTFAIIRLRKGNNIINLSWK